MSSGQAKRVRHALGVLMIAASPLPLQAQTSSGASTGTVAPEQEPPILPDEEFEARLPKAGESDTANPSAPLPSIDSWIDQQMPQARAPVELPPATEPAAEAELAQPLPPLDSVTVPAQVASESPNEKTPEIRYAV